MLEREHELDAIAAWLSVARNGHGRIGLVLAGAGLGKTALLDRAVLLGSDHGLRVLTARAGELESDMPFGVVRQLFETTVRELTDARRNAVFAGAAAPARSLLDPTESLGGVDRLAVTHGLYRLLANLAGRSPMLLVIDDLHWADPQTARWLAYLATRLKDIPVLVLAAARPSDPDGEEIVARIAGAPGVSSTELEPLGAGAVAELVTVHLGQTGDQEFVAACHQATGGNPFFLLELLRAVAADQLDPTAATAELVPDLGTKGIARSILVRLARLGDGAGRLANAAAILGSDAELRHAAALAGLETDEALEAWDALALGEILQSRQPLEFIHPIARTAVYNELPRGERTMGHRNAAELLASDHVDPQRIAVHALACEPAADPHVVAWLQSAAGSALLNGAPDAAAHYLERALEEPPPPDLRAQLKLELGRALIGLDSARAAASLAGAAESPDLSVRLLALRWQAYTLSFAGRLEEAMVVYDRAIKLASLDSETALHLTGTREFFAAWWGEEPNRAERRQLVQERAGKLTGDSAGERQVLGAAAVAAVMAGTVSARQAIDFAGRIRRSPIQWIEREGDVTQGADAFVQIVCDDPDVVELFENRAIPQCIREGRTVDLGFAQSCLVIAKFRQGALPEAEATARSGWELMRAVGEGAAVVYWWSAAALIEVLMAEGELEEVSAVFQETGFGEQPPTVVIFPWPIVLRGQLAIAQGRLAEGVEILREAGAWLEQRGFSNPAYIPWRARLAPALATLGRVDEAQAVIAPAVRRAREFGAPWALGMALRVSGAVTPGPRGIELLDQALDVLEPSPCRLEHAHALLDLGAALRRTNQRARAREHLRSALDMAHRCGATPLAARCAEELAATGARPRHALLSGVESLTASERRVADLAATGLSNPEIARHLFVTRKTVEAHLGHVYQKLDISSRQQILAALSQAR